jgi:peptidoglycan/xylan/chitin deacetylase (PgdA/CDA1 family)
VKPNPTNMGHSFILNFHGLGEPRRSIPASETDCWVDVAVFEGVLDLVRGRDNVRLTFDDANESDCSIALPRLQARRLKAWFFVVAQRIGRKSFLSADQLRALQAEGMTIGSHGLCHRNWRRLGPAELREELVLAREANEQMIDAPVLEAACPYGAYDRHLLKKLRQLGYRAAYTSDERPASLASWLRPRNTMLRSGDFGRIVDNLTHCPSGLPKFWRGLKLLVKRSR